MLNKMAIVLAIITVTLITAELVTPGVTLVQLPHQVASNNSVKDIVRIIDYFFCNTDSVGDNYYNTLVEQRETERTKIAIIVFLIIISLTFVILVIIEEEHVMNLIGKLINLLRIHW